MLFHDLWMALNLLIFEKIEMAGEDKLIFNLIISTSYLFSKMCWSPDNTSHIFDNESELQF